MIRLLLAFLAFTSVQAAEPPRKDAPVEKRSSDTGSAEPALDGAKSAGGYGYGYDGYNGYDGNNGNNGYNSYNSYNSRPDHSRQGYGSQYGYQRAYPQGRAYSHNQQLVPIKIPYINKDGCRFPGDVVCDTTNARNMLCNYRTCLLADENKNLWKKPTMTLAATTRCGTRIGVLTEFCNSNQKILVAIGFIKDKDGHNKPKHLSSITHRLDPCILARTVCP